MGVYGGTDGWIRRDAGIRGKEREKKPNPRREREEGRKGGRGGEGKSVPGFYR